jgi:hypothetical protein
MYSNKKNGRRALASVLKWTPPQPASHNNPKKGPYIQKPEQRMILSTGFEV